MRDPSFDSRFQVVRKDGRVTQIFERATVINGVGQPLRLIASGNFAPDVFELLQRMCDEHAQTQNIVMGRQHRIDRVNRKNERLEGELLRLSCELQMQQEANAELERERAAAWTELPEAEPGMFDEDVTEVSLDRLISCNPDHFPDNSGTDSFVPEVPRG